MMGVTNMPTGGCSEATPHPDLPSFCFGELSGAARSEFEAHLLECDFCWQEVQRLDAAVRLLRTEPHISYAPQVRLLGHLPHAVLAAGILASAYAVSLALEVAYAYDRFAASVLPASLSVWLWSFLTTLGCLAMDWRWTNRGKSNGLVVSGIALSLSAVLLYAGASLYLPNYPITQARIQTYPAQAAFLKSIGYFLPLTLVFLAVPYHAVIRLGRQLNCGDNEAVAAVFKRGKMRAMPAYLVLVRPAVLSVILLLAFFASLHASAHFFDNLLPGPLQNLFLGLAQLRRILFFVLGLECLCWYYWNLNELQRAIERQPLP